MSIESCRSFTKKFLHFHSTVLFANSVRISHQPYLFIKNYSILSYVTTIVEGRHRHIKYDYRGTRLITIVHRLNTTFSVSEIIELLAEIPTIDCIEDNIGLLLVKISSQDDALCLEF